MRECELFLGNLFVCEQLSGRERAGKLECSKTGKSSCVFKGVRVLLLKEPNVEVVCSFKGPVHMETRQPIYWVGSVGETPFIFCSSGAIGAICEERNWARGKIEHVPIISV